MVQESETIKVVIADDHSLFREGTRNILEKESDLSVVGEACDGQEAIDLVNRLHPDIVLMDISMPKVNGIEATKRIKSLVPGTAVLVLTAYDNDQYIFALLEAGAAGYLMKNVGGQDLVCAIRSVHAGESVLQQPIAQKVFNSLSSVSTGGEETAEASLITERELEILKQAAKGLDNEQIAAKLFLSPRTVQSHLSHIFQKMGVGSRTEAILQALKKRWLTLKDINSD